MQSSMKPNETNHTVTIKHISKLLGVSPSTVSRALQGKKGVGEATRKDICELAHSLGYQPNKIAQSLRLKTSNVLGVLIPDNQNPFFSSMIKGVTAIAQQEGYILLVVNTNNDPGTEQQALATLQELHIAGILAVPNEEKNYENFKLPFLFLTRCRDRQGPFNYITTDDEEGAYLAANHLIESQMQEYFFLCDSLSVTSSQNRLAGFSKALKEHGIDLPPANVRQGANAMMDGYKMFQEIAGGAKTPFGIFCHNDYVAIGVLQSILDSPLRIKKDVRLIGYDDIEMISFITPRLSTIRQAKFDVGTWGAKHLISLIRNGPAANPIHIVMKPELVLRDT